MIALGIDPGAKWTGFALIDARLGGPPLLLDSLTLDRSVEGPYRPGDDLLELEVEYLDAVALTARLFACHDAHTPQVVAVEWLRRPSWRHAGKAKPVDPTAVMATAIVLGVVVDALRDLVVGGHALERVRPMGNGRLLPLPHYPAPLGTTGKGTDKLRHERSAFDVGMMGAQQARTGRNRP